MLIGVFGARIGPITVSTGVKYIELQHKRKNQGKKFILSLTSINSKLTSHLQIACNVKVYESMKVYEM